MFQIEKYSFKLFIYLRSGSRDVFDRQHPLYLDLVSTEGGHRQNNTLAQYIPCCVSNFRVKFKSEDENHEKSQN